LRIVTRVQPDYPARFWHLPDPPGAIWIKGRWPLPDEAVAVVGARQASSYGERHARRLGRELSRAGVLVVSGAASGIDRAAHEGALEQGLTVAILGCGLDHVYPARHRRLYQQITEGGALISEFPPEVPPQPGFFPMRNRLIAALVYGVVVVEARQRSGSLITADLALELGREVFALPGPACEPGSEGPHVLLRTGACLVESAADIMHALDWPLLEDAVPPAVALSPEQSRVCEFLGDVPVPFDVLAGQTGFPPARLGAVLMTLEMNGAVRALPGGRYARA
jgi:DNA processing protein